MDWSSGESEPEELQAEDRTCAYELTNPLEPINNEDEDSLSLLFESNYYPSIKYSYRKI